MFSLLKSTFNYIKSKGLWLFLIVLAPSALISFLVSPTSALYTLCGFTSRGATTFVSVYLSVLGMDVKFYWIGIIGCILMVFVISVLFGTVDRHMRVGEFTVSFRRAKTRIDFNFMTALKFMLVSLFMFELYNLFIGSLCFLWSSVFDNAKVGLGFSVVSFMVMGTLLLMGFVNVLLWPPFMLHSGMSSNDAYRMCIREQRGYFFKTCITLALPMLVLMVLVIINGAAVHSRVFTIIADTLCYAVMAVFYISMMYVRFYEVTGTERADLIQKDIWHK